MPKKRKQQNENPKVTIRDDSGGAEQPDQALVAVEQALEWALDIASGIARDFPEEVEAIERVRWYMRKRLRGEPALLSAADVLFVIGLIIGSIEYDPGPPSLRFLRLAEPMWFPGAAQLWERGLIRHVIRAQLGGGAFTRHASA